METTIKKRVKGSIVEAIFESDKNCNIRYYSAKNAENYDPENVYTFEINIRHSEDQDPKELLETAINNFNS